MKTIIILIFAFLIGAFVFQIVQANQKEIVTVQIMNLQQQQLITGGSGNTSVKTEIRYLVITDKETFIVENSWLNGKFANSDIFWRLKKDSTYKLEVCGLGKSFLTDYRNILKIKK